MNNYILRTENTRYFDTAIALLNHLEIDYYIVDREFTYVVAYKCCAQNHEVFERAFESLINKEPELNQ